MLINENLTVEEYEKKIRNMGCFKSENDIAFMVDVYKKHLAMNSDDAQQYSDFAENCIKEDVCHDDIELAIDTIDKLRRKPKIVSSEKFTPVADDEAKDIMNFIQYKKNNLGKNAE